MDADMTEDNGPDDLPDFPALTPEQVGNGNSNACNMSRFLRWALLDLQKVRLLSLSRCWLRQARISLCAWVCQPIGMSIFPVACIDILSCRLTYDPDTCAPLLSSSCFRLTPLKQHWMDLYTPVVQHMKLDIRYNVKRKCVELKVRVRVGTSQHVV